LCGAHREARYFVEHFSAISGLTLGRGLIVVAPTGGVGRWTIDETNTRVPAALAGAKRVVAVDPRQIHAIGLSNGGRAVSQLLASSKGDYRSFVFLSPVFREESVRALANATVNALSQLHVSGKSFNAHLSPFN
jgi:poly(3-hydroxybutyrate) depolymerase